MTQHTKRLYHDNPYTTKFTATIVELLPNYKLPSPQPPPKNYKPQVAYGVVLDETYFYPNSGGQLNDVGTFITTNQSTLNVFDVVLEEPSGRIVHLIESPSAEHDLNVNDKVEGRIDWPTRLDHTQQHHGQHILSAAFLQVANIETLSFHMNKKISYIDLNSIQISDQILEQVQTLTNDIISQGCEVGTSFHTLEEAKQLNLRKQLDAEIQEPVRIVKIGDFDQQPCCGTHPNSSSEVGSVVVISTEKIKKVTRLSFICGTRVTQYATQSAQVLKKVASKLGCAPDAIEKTLEQVLESSTSTKKMFAEAEKLLVQKVAKEIASNPEAPQSGAFSLYSQVLSGDLSVVSDVNNMRRIVKDPIFSSRSVLILLGPTDTVVNFVVAASDDVVKQLSLDLRPLIKDVFVKTPGKGGGAASMIQGSFQTTDANLPLQELVSVLRSK